MILAIAIYAASMLLANLTVAHFGPAVTPINAFVLIGLDLALRDWLHVRLKTWEMGALIAGTSVLTFALNPAAGQIALASAVSFGVAALADWLVFVRVPGTWFRRSVSSNVAGAAVDSVLFPTLAFGMLLPQIVLAQFVAKVVGGAIWAWLMTKAQPSQAQGASPVNARRARSSEARPDRQDKTFLALPLQGEKNKDQSMGTK